MTAALQAQEWPAARPARTLPPGKTQYPFYRRLGGPQGRSGRAENLVPTGIRSRTVKPVAQSLYRLSYPAHPRSVQLFIITQYTQPISRRYNRDRLYVYRYSSRITAPSIFMIQCNSQTHSQAASMSRFLDHKQTHNPSKTPLNESWARRSVRYLQNKHTQETEYPCPQQDRSHHAAADLRLNPHSHRDRLTQIV